MQQQPHEFLVILCADSKQRTFWLMSDDVDTAVRMACNYTRQNWYDDINTSIIELFSVTLDIEKLHKAGFSDYLSDFSDHRYRHYDEIFVKQVR